MYAEFIKAICGKTQSCSSEECIMYPFALSLFDTGLLVVVVILVLLFLVVLIKLKPSTGQEKIAETKSLKRNVPKVSSAERRNIPVTYSKNREEHEERPKAIERPESVPPMSVETEKPEISRNNQSAGCPHRLGYLKEHPKHTPIPNECLTCNRIMECLAGAE